MLYPTNHVCSDIKELTITVTNKCDLECSFCGGKSYMVDTEPSLDIKLSQLESVLAANPFIESVAWSGGEPLLKTKHIAAMLRLVKEKLPNVTNVLYTNGLSLTKTDIGLLDSFDEIFISFDGFRESERPLVKVFENGQDGFLERLGLLKAELYVWSVLTHERLKAIDWADDICELHSVLFNYPIVGFRLILDNDMPKPLSTDQVLNFITGYEKTRENLEKLSWLSGDKKNLTVNKFFDKHCEECRFSAHLSTNGVIYQRKVPDAFLNVGCHFLSESIGSDAYTYINNYLNAKRIYNV